MKDAKLGQYTITRKLGEGGIAQVWEARHGILGHKVAIKLLLPQMAGQGEHGVRFKKEAEALARLNHPGIVKILDIATTESGKTYIVLEYLSGEPLSRLLKRESQLPVEQTLRLVRQLTSAMNAAHAENILHRDLKPDNLFVVPDPDVAGNHRIKVLDFGLAKLTSELMANGVTTPGAIFGTPAYMSPEQCVNSASVDHRTDLYSIGCIFYRCLCGRTLFEVPQNADPTLRHLAMMQAHLNHDVVPPIALRADIPMRVNDLVMRLVTKSPGERVQTCDELLAELDRLSIPEPTAEKDSGAMKTMIFVPNWESDVDATHVRRPRHLSHHDAVPDMGGNDSTYSDGVPAPVSPNDLVDTERMAAWHVMGAPVPPAHPPPMALPGVAGHGWGPRSDRPYQGSSNSSLSGAVGQFNGPINTAARRRSRRVRIWIVAVTIGALGIAVIVYGTLGQNEADVQTPATTSDASRTADSAEQPPSSQTVGPGKDETPETMATDKLEPESNKESEPAPSSETSEDESHRVRTPKKNVARPDEATKLSSREIEALLEASTLASRRGEYGKAHQACRRVVDHDRRHVRANILCALSACRLNRKKRAAYHYRVLSESDRVSVHRLCKREGIELPNAR